MERFFKIRVRIFLRQCSWGFALMASWFAFGTFIFYRWERLPLGQAFLDALYLGHHPSSFQELYSFWGQGVLFGIVISIFLLQALQQYNPQEGCRMLAQEMKNHTIIIGYTHFGARIVEYLQRNNQPYVLIEKDATAVDDLVRDGGPVIVDNAKEENTLEEAGIQWANLVVVASNNVETALLVTKKARERNKKAVVIVRCFQDEFTEVLESLGANEVISSSRSAFDQIAHHLNST